MQIDTARAFLGAVRRLRRRELWRSARTLLLVAAVVAGLLGMHVLGDHAGPVAPAAGAHPAGPMQAAGPGQHAAPAQHMDPAQQAGSLGACAHAQPGPGGAMAHCTPAPGALPPAPPGDVVLGRSDALQRAPRAAVPAAVRPRAPAPDLAELSISRT
ncbi:DUF6153 family protein [Sinomonas atrocyanea]|uniref:DUF6153 family protein n=1 Tax=Sinomonas atrocyanea TaxID=37927 RepID=UPI0011423FF8|nr:DUF6153 family protein [Sinomonas atrocyanea]